MRLKLRCRKDAFLRRYVWVVHFREPTGKEGILDHVETQGWSYRRAVKRVLDAMRQAKREGR